MRAISLDQLRYVKNDRTRTYSYAGKCGPEKLQIRTLFTQ